MNDIFIMETNEGWILIYIDDILIFSKRKEELQKLTLRVLKKLQENDLFANLLWNSHLKTIFHFVLVCYCLALWTIL